MKLEYGWDLAHLFVIRLVCVSVCVGESWLFVSSKFNVLDGWCGRFQMYNSAFCTRREQEDWSIFWRPFHSGHFPPFHKNNYITQTPRSLGSIAHPHSDSCTRHKNGTKNLCMVCFEYKQVEMFAWWWPMTRTRTETSDEETTTTQHNDKKPWTILYIPFRTWTLTVLGFAWVGKHVYFPESDILAFCMSKYDVVTSPFSVMTDTPPRGES